VRIGLLAEDFVPGFVPGKLVLKGHPQSIPLSQKGADCVWVAGSNQGGVGNRLPIAFLVPLRIKADIRPTIGFDHPSAWHWPIKYSFIGKQCPWPRRRPHLQRRPQFCVAISHHTPPISDTPPAPTA